MKSARAIGVIPARYASQRFPGKPLALIGGRTMIQRVHERARRAETLDKVLIATDDTRIRDAAASFGAEVVMTAPDAPSGTDRIVEAVGHLDYDIVVNIQGDEPFLDARAVDECVTALRENPELSVATLAELISEPDELLDPGIVKVVTDDRGDALYFSRSLIPYPRGYEGPDGDLEIERIVSSLTYHKHIGLYAYRHASLMRFASLKPAPLEMIEKLEQLRFLQAGGRIRVIEVEGRSVSVDTPEDLAVAERLCREYDSVPGSTG